MEPISSLVTGAIIPALAFGIKILLDIFFVRQTKEITVQLDHGKKQTVIVAGDADAGEVVRAFQTELNIEQYVQKVLKQYESNVKHFHQRRGDAVDFIAEAGSKKVAIEVKNRLDSLNLDQMNRYFSREPGLKQLLIISPQSVPPKVLSETKELVDSGRLSFVQVSDFENPTSELPQVVGRALEVALPNNVSS